MDRARKRRATTLLAKHLVNPPVRTLHRLGWPVPGCALLETTGRNSGRARVTPVTDGRDGEVFWVVSEHGRQAGYVRNLEADPQVRVRTGHRWRTGTARVLPSEDPQARLAALGRDPAARLSARVVALMSTDPVVVRIDLDP